MIILIIMFAMVVAFVYFLCWRPYKLENYDIMELPPVSDLNLLKDVDYKPPLSSKLPPIYGKPVDWISQLSLSFFGQTFILPAIAEQFEITNFRKRQYPNRQVYEPIGPWPSSNDSFRNAGNSKRRIKPYICGDTTTHLDAYYKNVLRNCKTSRIHEILNKFETKEITPVEYMEKIIQNIQQDPCYSITQYDIEWIRVQAKEANQRYYGNDNQQKSMPIRPLEGVPFAVKEMCHVSGFYRNCGVPNHQTQISTEISTHVQRLLQQGAVFIGTTNLHQLGIGITGVNSSKGYHGGARNPHALQYYTGGSSSGSASAVASNLVAFAIGNDGGGSIRIPSSHCGIVGLKPSFGRISLSGESCELTSNCTHSGPMCASVSDCAYIYGVMAGNDNDDHILQSLKQPQPKPYLTLPSNRPKSYNIGLWEDWIEKGSSYRNMGQITMFRNIVKAFELETDIKLNRDFRIPELYWARTAHLISIISECTFSGMHLLHNSRETLCNDTLTYVTAGSRVLRITDFICAGKQRARSMDIMQRVFHETGVDVFITPTLGVDVGQRHPGDAIHTNINNGYTGNMMNFIFLGNLIGIPCISVPIGNWLDKKTGKTIPTGIQICGPWWREDLVLDFAARVETIVGDLGKPHDCYFEY